MDGLSGNYEEHSSVAELLFDRLVPEIPKRQGQVKRQV